MISRDSLGLKKIIILSLIGGVSGAIESIVAYAFSFIIAVHNLIAALFFGGVGFIIVGTGLIIPLIVAVPEFAEKKFSLLIFGAIGGFIAGIFFHFGIGLYLGIVIYSVFIGLKTAWEISIGGIIGGFGGVIVSTFFLMALLFAQKAYPALENQVSILAPIISTTLIIYFMNFGMLISLKWKKEKRRRGQATFNSQKYRI